MKIHNLRKRYKGSTLSLKLALHKAAEAGAITIDEDLVKLRLSIRRIVLDSLAIEVKANSAPAALSHSLRYRNYAHKTAIIVPNGIQKPGIIREKGVGLIKPIGDKVMWAMLPKKIGPIIPSDEILTEEILLDYLYTI